jgi:hypothetical protein
MPRPEQDPVDAVLDAMRDKRNAREALLDTLTEVPDYVWCEQRGSIHDTIMDQHTTMRHGSVVFYDLFQDGELCTAKDHKPVYTTGEID